MTTKKIRKSHSQVCPDNWKQLFIDGLKIRGVIRDGCEKAHVGRDKALREREKDPIFAAEWENAIEWSLDNLESVGMERAYRSSDRLLMFFLSSRRPHIYGKRETINMQADVRSQNKTEVHYDDDQLSQVLSVLQSVGAIPVPGEAPGTAEGTNTEAD